MDPIITAPITTSPTAPAQPAVAPPAAGAGMDGMSTAVASQIKAFTGGWGKGQGSGVGTRSREFEFTAYIGQYSGGNWNSTVRISAGKQIETGSLPNLLYLMSAWSKDKIKTNYKNVQDLKLDSDEIFSVKPQFIFLPGPDFADRRRWKTFRNTLHGRMHLGRQLLPDWCASTSPSSAR
jgi:hypothetical protein